MNAEILSVGTELLLGDIVNTNARDLSEALSELGINVFWHTAVGDNPERLTACVEVARKRADLIITTGGLGPTYDDLTKQTLAKAFGMEMYFDEEIAEGIRAWFEERRHIRMSENNLQQAYLPVGCTVLQNDWGTAPGCIFEKDGVHVVMLPGPPAECIPLFRHRAAPYLRKLSGAGQILSHSLRIYGMGESTMEMILREQMQAMTNPTLAPYAKQGEAMLRVTARADTEEEAEQMIQPVLEELRGVLGDVIYGQDVASLEEAVNALLREKNKTLTAAESCTGGYLAKRMTDIPGASQHFLGGVTVYTNEAKVRLLGLDPEELEKNGAVSEETAAALAKRVREVLGSDLGVGITGVAGPDGDGVHPVGTVFIAVSDESGETVHKKEFGSGRERTRHVAVTHALDMVRRRLSGLSL